MSTITLPETLTDIAESAFSSCKGLLRVILPASVSLVGKYAFSACSAMTAVQVLNPTCEIYDYNGTLGTNTQVTIHGYAGSTAEAYAQKYSYTFSLIEE